MNLRKQDPRMTSSHYLHVRRCNSRRALHKDAWYEKDDVYTRTKGRNALTPNNDQIRLEMQVY